MLADIFGMPASIADVGSFLAVVATVSFAKTKRWRDGRHDRESVQDIWQGVPAVIDKTGKEIAAERPSVPQRLTTVETKLDKLSGQVEALTKAATPNGGDTNSVGDIGQRNEQKLDLILDHLGLHDVQ